MGRDDVLCMDRMEKWWQNAKRIGLWVRANVSDIILSRGNVYSKLKYR